jgi:hypothetical protein
MMSKQYLKMADVFRNEMRVVGDSSNMIADDVGIIIGCYSGDKMAEYVLHAINSHDELVAENERLISVLYEVDRVLSEMQKNGVLAYGIDDLIDEVSHSIQS